MGDWPQGQDYNRVSITSASLESVGSEVDIASQTFAGSAAWPAANRAIFVPFVLNAPLTVTQMFNQNSTASGNVDVGIYDATQNRVVSSGSTAVAGSTIQVFDITDTLLQAGLYYFAMAVDNTTATFLSAPIPSLAITQSFGVLSQSSAFALPDPAVFAAAQDAYIPLVGLISRALL